MAYKYQEIIFSGLLFLLGVALFWHTFAEQYQPAFTLDNEMSPMLYPRIILGGWSILSLLMFINALRSTPVVKEFCWKRVFMALGMMLALIVLINLIGFIIPAVLFFLGFALFLGYRKYLIAVCFAVVVPVVIFFIFDRGLGVLLPTCPWSIM